MHMNRPITFALADKNVFLANRRTALTFHTRLFRPVYPLGPAPLPTYE